MADDNPKKPRLPFVFSKIFGGLARFFRESAVWKRFLELSPHIGLIVAVLAVTLVSGLLVWKFGAPRKSESFTVSYTPSPPSTTAMLRESAAPLIIRFQGSAAKTEDIGKVLDYPIELKPPISGTWRWESDTDLHFNPEERWPIGTEYQGRLPVSEMFPEHIEVEAKFSFSIAPLRVRLTSGEFYIDPQDSAVKRVLTSISSNYPLEPASLEGRISMTPDLRSDSGRLESRPYDFSVNYSEDYLEAYIVSEPLGIPADDVTMRIVVDPGLRSSLGGEAAEDALTSRVKVPGASSFVKVLSMEHSLVPTQEQGYDQVFVISTKGRSNLPELARNLTVYRLPRDRPPLPGLGGVREDHRWGDIDEMVPGVLELAVPVEIEAVPGELEYSSVNSFRFRAEPGRHIYVKLKEGTRFYGDYFLSDASEAIFQVKEYPREIRILSDGSLLSMSGDKRLSVMSRGVSGIRYRIGRIRPDDVNHLVTQSNGNISNFQFSGYRFDEYNITEQYTENERITITDPSKPEYVSFDFSGYLSTIPERQLRYGLFFFEAEDTDPYSSRGDKRLIMVTDLGMLVKKNRDGTQDVFVQSIADGAPLPGVRVQVLGVNGNPVASGFTAADGHLQFPDLSNLGREREPTAFTAVLGSDMSFLPYEATGRFLDYSSFNVGGVRGAADPSRLNAFLFSDRGIYRPGDEIRLGAVVKAGDWGVDIGGTPMECRVIDPQGSEIYTEEFSLSSAGFEEITFPTQEYSPTGRYDVSLFLRRRPGEWRENVLLGSIAVDVEEFLPDNLNLSASFFPLPSPGWTKPDTLTGMVSVRNLFGTPAAGNKVTAQVTLTPGYRRFPGFGDYRFFDPFLKDSRYEEYLGEKETDENGSVEFPVNLDLFEKASYNLRFYTEAYEKGSGRNVSYETTTFISPLDYMVGYRADGDLNYINMGAERNVEFIAVDPELNRTRVTGLTVNINEMRYVSVLVRQPNGVFKYQSVRKPYLRAVENLDVSREGTSILLPADAAGDFEITVTDLEGETYASFAYSVIGAANVERRLDRSAELEITLNKEDYQAGEFMDVFIKAPYAGAGLITVERDKVYSYQWFRSTGSSTVQRVRVPAELEGNGYVNVSFVRSRDSREIFMSPLSYGAVPFSVSRERRTNRVTLEVPDEAKPGEPFPIRYSSSRPGRIVVYAVDEGILQVASYDTPDPLGFFFQKRAMEVSTAQILDLILPEFSIVQSLAAMGGGAADALLSRNLNPFRRRRVEPAAYWSGILDSGPEGGTLIYDVPDHFNGTLRVMAVAVSDDAVGAGESSALIRDSFVIRPAGPLSAAPGDEFEVAVTVANNEKGSGEGASVSLEAVPSEHLEVISEPVQNLSIDEGGDVMTVFRIRAGETLGGAELKFRAAGARESSDYSSFMSIRPPVPFRTTLHSGMVRRGSGEIDITRRLIPEFATHELSLSYLPLGLAKGLHFFLQRYPFGCTEQIVSSTFPLLYPELTAGLNLSASQGEDKIRDTVAVLQARQKSDGSIGLWTSRSEADPLIDIYAMLFLTEVRKSGIFVSDSLYGAGMERLASIAESARRDEYGLTNRAFAVYVLTLNEEVTTRYIESLRDDLDEYYEDWESDFPGLYLAGSYSMLQLTREASAIFGRIRRVMKRYEDNLYLDRLGFTSMYLHILSRHSPRRLANVSEELLVSIAEELESRFYTTYSANLTLMAVSSYLAAAPGAEEGRFTVTETLDDGSQRPLTPEGEGLFIAEFSPRASAVAIRNPENLNLFYQAAQAGFDAELGGEAMGSGIEIFREYRNSRGSASNSFTLGDAVTAVLRFRSLELDRVDQVAVVDIIPAGFEVDIASLRDGRSGGWKPDYVDIREDRVVIFGTVTRDMDEFTYTLRAINKGEFTTPPAYAEAMYDNAIWSVKPMERVSVK